MSIDLTVEMRSQIRVHRTEARDALNSNDRLFVAIGACAMLRSQQMIDEARVVNEISDENIYIVRREPPWKPRTPRPELEVQPWEGLETTDQQCVYEQIHDHIENKTPLAIELGKKEHLKKYARFIAMGWIGSRNCNNRVLDDYVSIDPELWDVPIGIKNGLDGDMDSVIQRIEHMDLVRKRRSGGFAAGAYAIYRGGVNAKNPSAWEEEYKKAYEKTEGRIILDLAHGSEMAHDPCGEFKKSPKAQLICAEHAINVSSSGYKPAGIMIEATDHVISDDYYKTDPPISTIDAINISLNISKT